MRRRIVRSLMVAGALALACSSNAAALGDDPIPGAPNFGSSVYLFDPSMPQSQIQATVDAIGNQQVNNEFGPQRYALLFKPGTYGSTAHPLNFQVGYYTAVAGLGLSPHDVVINGSVYVRNRCLGPGNCIALDNFWRSLSNLTINVTTPGFGCYSGQFWAVSQAAPMRRGHGQGRTPLMEYFTRPPFAPGGGVSPAPIPSGGGGGKPPTDSPFSLTPPP